MSIHPSLRPSPPKGDVVPPGIGEGPMPAADQFTVIVTGLSTTEATAGDSDGAKIPQGKTGTETGSDPGEAATASVEQLLALVTASHGKASPRQPKEKSASEKAARTDAIQTASPDTAAIPSILPATATSPALPIATASAGQPQPPVDGTPQPLPALKPAIATAAPAPSAQAVPPDIAAIVAQMPTTASATPPASPATPSAVAAASPLAAAAPVAATAANPAPQTANVSAPSSPAPGTQPATAIVQPLPNNLSGKNSPKPATVDRDGIASSSSPVAPATAMQPRLADQPFLASTPTVAAADTQRSDAAAAAPLQGLVIERQLDLAHQQDWIDQVARDIAGAAGGDGKTLSFRLNPEHLGTLQVEIAQTHHGAAVRFSTDSEAARSLIADAQPRLVAEARAQGVRISEAHVDLGGSGAGDPRRQTPAAPDMVQVKTARSLQEDQDDDGKPSPNRSDLYA